MKFIALRVRNALVMHGYAADQSEIVEQVEDEAFVEKLIALERIQSISEQYVLLTSSHGRQLYWEYEGDLATIKARLALAGLLID